jgi:hypothetical protein
VAKKLAKRGSESERERELSGFCLQILFCSLLEAQEAPPLSE